MSTATPSRARLRLERFIPALARLRRADSLPVELDRRRIYVVPTRFGMGLALLLLVMLVGALNYANNPALLLTCLLASAAWTSVFSGFRVLHGLRVTAIEPGECHAGGVLPLALEFDASPRARPALQVRADAAHAALTLPAGTAGRATLQLPVGQRGWLALPRLRIWTTWPLGLFHCWVWLRPDIRTLVYARLETPLPVLPHVPGGQGEHPTHGDDEAIAGLRDYRRGDPPRMVAWKASARHETLLVREAEPAGAAHVMFDYHALADLDHEQRISRLSTWVCMAHARLMTYGLRLPGQLIRPAADDGHRRACLRALALLPRADD